MNNGITFEPIFDDQAVSSIGDVTLAPSDPSILYVGTGEPNNRQSSSWGNGVYRTPDGGKTWTHVGLAGHAPHRPHRGAPDATPTSPTWPRSGHLWGPEQGARPLQDDRRRRAPGRNTKFIDEDTGFVDVAMDPQSPRHALRRVLPAAAHAVRLQRRRPGQRACGRPRRRRHLEEADERAARRTATSAASASPSTARDPRIVYALVEHAKEGGIYRSDDRGETLAQDSRTPTRGRPTTARSTSTRTTTSASGCWARRIYYSRGRRQDLQDRPGARRSTATTTRSGSTPPTPTTCWSAPTAASTLARPRPHLGLREHGAAGPVLRDHFDMRQPYWVCGGPAGQRELVRTQPHVCTSRASATRTGSAWAAATASTPWSTRPTTTSSTSRARTATCSGSTCAPHERRVIRPEPPDGEKYRFNWNSPILISPHDPKTIYYGGNRLFGSKDRGDTWTLVATRPDERRRARQPDRSSARPRKDMLSRNDGVVHFGTDHHASPSRR